VVARPQVISKLIKPLFSVITVSLLLIQMLAILCALAKPAYAYVDPGSGLLAFQIISTTFAGAIFLVRKRLRQLFGRAILTRHPDPKSDTVSGR
jgi:hypothetical protein